MTDWADRAQEYEERARADALRRARGRVICPDCNREVVSLTPAEPEPCRKTICPFCGEEAVQAADGLPECDCRRGAIKGDNHAGCD